MTALPLPPHRTARERRAQQSAQAAIARAWAHTRRPTPEPSPDTQAPPTTAWDGGPQATRPEEVACMGCYRPIWGYPGDLCNRCQPEETTQP